MTKAIAQTHNLAYEYGMRISLALMIVSIALALFYVINIYVIISRTVAMQKVDSEIKSTENVVKSLDAKYLELSNKIAPDNLGAYDMSQGKVSEYISRGSSSALSKVENVSRVAVGSHEL